MPFRKRIFLMASFSDRGMISNCVVSLAGITWWSTMLVGKETAHLKMSSPALYSTFIRVNQCAIAFFSHLTYTQLSWTNITNQSVKVA